ncbi:hypothetical protein N665_0636s0023 [Sinapis alba]|nr:hypothetical protein N665_0636s0023 [Sinapis alba]
MENGKKLAVTKYLTYSVSSIQFGYVENGALVLSKKYGSDSPLYYHSTRIVRLNHVSEFVTGISGELYIDCYINSLTFHTNERSHEAFRAELKCDESSRWVPAKMEFHSGIYDRREFGGFFGSCKYSSLSSIGLYIKPVISGVHTIKHEDV